MPTSPVTIERAGRVVRALVLTAVVIFCGCLRTRIPAQADLDTLRFRSSLRPIPFDARAPGSGVHVGYQFVLGLIPLGRISVEQSSTHLRAAMEGAMNGRGLTLSAPSQRRPLLRVTVLDQSLNGFDAIFTRRVVARVTLAASCLEDPSYPELQSRRESAVGEHTMWKKYAFEKQLSFALEKAYLEAATRLVESLGYSACLRMTRGRALINHLDMPEETVAVLQQLK